MSELFRTTINREGRLVIPAQLRKSAGLQPGQELLLRQTPTGLELTTFDAEVSAFRNAVTERVGTNTTLVEDLMTERRADAEKEPR